MHPSSPAQVTDAVRMPAFLVSSTTNIRYLAGVEVSSGFLLVTPRRFMLFVDERYGEAVAKQVRKGIEVRRLSSLGVSLARFRECGCESDEVTLAQFARWRRIFKNTKFVQKSGVIEDFRRTKGPDELRKFRRAQAITCALLAEVPMLLREGITERELARKLRDLAEGLGADSLAFEPIVAFGTHTSQPHHHPTDRAFRRGSLVQIDVGARFRGYCSDRSIVLFTGRKTREQERAYRAVMEAKEAAIALVKVGVSTHVLDQTACRILCRHGYKRALCHSLGHGVGLEIHEGVSISVRAPEKFLRRGEIVTIEPGVYFAGRFGIRLEEEVIVR